MENKHKYAVPALDKCFEILEFLAEKKRPCGQSEIARGTGRSANEIFRILVNLELNGYLLRDPSTGKYRLSFKLYNLSRSISPLDELRQQALPLMEDLAVECGLSCQLSVFYQSQTMVLVHAKSPGAVSLSVAEGALFPTLTTNAGKVLLANSKPEVQMMICERSDNWHSYTTIQQQAILNDINQLASVDAYEAPSCLIDGVRELVTLVGQYQGKQIAALSLSAIGGGRAAGTQEYTSTYFSPSHRDALLATAKNITQVLGL